MTSKIVINTYDDFRALEGKQIVDSQPVEITAQGIQDFCRGTLNDEWIHWDEERCKASPLGNLIAPGLYLPALFPNMFWDAMEVNIPRIIVKGIDGIRIFKPVTVGSKIIGRATVEKVLDRTKGIEVHYAISFVFADTDEQAAIATFINRYWE
ncbi:MAG: MaoC/PaaZ C-terminal domain-containing protein [Gammaproteobacteria bacterium]